MEVQKFIPIESQNKNQEMRIGDVVEGTVKSIKPYGAFIETASGTTGLLYIENISVARIKSPRERLSVGEKINVLVKNIDEKNRIEFSYKELFGTWEDNVKEFQEGMVVQGKIKETEKNKNGIFIELKPNLIGMAEYSEGYKYGQKVDVFIKRIIQDKKKIKLIIK